MNHLNFFTYYQNMNPKHENNLTRAFLICLENIPSVQLEFFKLISKSHGDNLFDSSCPLGTILEETYTQISNRNLILNRDYLVGRKLVSILISDERLSSFSDVNNDERNAIYDGVILCKPNLLFVVENKPNIKNLWEKQLNPNVRDEQNIEVDKTPCSVSWSEIITIFNNLLRENNLLNIEEKLVSDFISYIDYYRPELNPYVNFKTCNGNKELINKRCKGILSNIEINGEYKQVEYHPGWGNYVRSGISTVTQIKIDYCERNLKKYVRLEMVSADTQISSKYTYQLLSIKKLMDLMNDESIEVLSNFHYQHMNKNLIWFKGNISVFDYLNFWQSNRHLLKQINRHGNNRTHSFNEFNKILIENGILDDKGLNDFEMRIASKKYMTLNICAGFIVTKYWELDEAIELDNKAEFVKSAENEIERIYNIFNQSIFNKLE